MAGVSGRSGSVRRTVWSRVMRISLGPGDADLLPFFDGLGKLPGRQRNAALLAAVRGGAGKVNLEAVESAEDVEAAGEFLM